MKPIFSNDPNAVQLLTEKITVLEAKQNKFKRINKLVRQFKDVNLLAEKLKETWPEIDNATALAFKLLTPDFAGRLGIPDYELINNGAVIRQAKKRLASLTKVET